MENASKALIIAGAILLSILIIALGIYVYNMAAGTIGSNPFTEMEVSQFNEPFESYSSDQILGSSVRKLIDKLITNTSTNAKSADKLPDIYYIDDTGKGPNMTNVVNAANSNVTSGTNRSVTITSDVDVTSTQAMTALKLLISNSHYYKVYFEYDATTALINKVYIDYNP